MNWVRQSWQQAKRTPLPALAFTFGVLTVMLSSLTGFMAWRAAEAVGREEEARIQLACEMSYANGQALLDTVTDVEPEVVERYRQNLQRRANEAIRKYDPEFVCKIPEESTAP